MTLATIPSSVMVVTGAARGIGHAIAAACIARGNTVVIADVYGADAAALALGPLAHARTLDVADPTAVALLVQEVEQTLGPIAVWVNNAGVMPRGAFAEQDLVASSTVVDVNYKGVLHGTRCVLPGMLARGSGHIVNLASATAAHPIAGLAAYSGTKAAVVAFSRAVRRELRGTGVSLSVVLPYLAATPMGEGIRAQPGFRAVTAEEVAHSVLSLLDNRRFIAFVPGSLRFASALMGMFPLWLRDWVDDRLLTDRIGLG